MKKKTVSVTQICKGWNDKFFNGPLFTDKGNLTNDHWLIKKEFIPKNLLKRAIKKEDGIIAEHDYFYDNINKAAPTKKLPGRKKSEFINGYVITYTFDNGIEQEEVHFDENYILFFERWIKDFNLKVYSSENPAYIYSGDKLAGLLMLVME